jgi:hypothetical protein
VQQPGVVATVTPQLPPVQVAVWQVGLVTAGQSPALQQVAQVSLGCTPQILPEAHVQVPLVQATPLGPQSVSWQHSVPVTQWPPEVTLSQ